MPGRYNGLMLHMQMLVSRLAGLWLSLSLTGCLPQDSTPPQSPTPSAIAAEASSNDPAATPSRSEAGSPPPPPVSPELTPEMAALATKYHLLVALKHPPASTWAEVGYTELTQADLDSTAFAHYNQILAQEFGKYPLGLVELAHLKAIAVVRNLSYASQLRAAVPDFVKEILYLDAYRGNSNETYQRHVIHHEYYHLLEQEVYGSVYYKDPQWAAFNPADFSYGSGGVNAQSGPQYDLVHPQTGFINRYATSGLEEDKAEVYAALMIPAEARLLESWSQTDSVLRAKVAAMKAFLKSRVPVIDEAFWNQLQP